MLVLALLILGAGAREVRLVMGTPAEVRVAAAAPQRALDAAFAALDLVDQKMSLWKESELLALNRSGGGAASPELLAVLVHALDVARASGGAFDPTVEPLVRAAGGFGGPRRALRPDELQQLLGRVGWTRVHVEGDAIRLEPGTRLDLSGIAKGFGVDLALRALREAGAQSGLVDLGQSSIGTFGDPITLDLRDPELLEGRPWGVFRLSDGHASTSAADQRADHLLDPRSGRPARGLLSATVVAHSGMEADALSTAAFVLGPEASLALLERRGAEGILLLREGGRAIARATPGFADRYGLRTRSDVRLRAGAGAHPSSRVP